MRFYDLGTNNRMLKNRIITFLSIAIAIMGIIHVIATFTPLIGAGLELLPQTKHNAMIYMSFMCGMLLIVCGLLVATLHSKVKEYSFLRLPYKILLIALFIDGITSVAFMPHNPFAWMIFILIACLGIISVWDNRKISAL